MLVPRKYNYVRDDVVDYAVQALFFKIQNVLFTITILFVDINTAGFHSELLTELNLIKM